MTEMGEFWKTFEPRFDSLTGQQIHFYIKFGYIYMEIEELSTSREGSRIEKEIL